MLPLRPLFLLKACGFLSSVYTTLISLTGKHFKFAWASDDDEKESDHGTLHSNHSSAEDQSEYDPVKASTSKRKLDSAEEMPGRRFRKIK
jgi:hypothetical protein